MGKFEDYIIQNQNLPLWRWLNICDCHVITAMWSTRHTVDTHKDKDLYIKTTLRELVIYLLFLAILCAREYSWWSLRVWIGTSYPNISLHNSWLLVGLQFVLIEIRKEIGKPANPINLLGTLIWSICCSMARNYVIKYITFKH